MASDLLVKRLMLQASVSVLTGFLLSSAVMAEDNTEAAEGSDISIEGNAPDVAVDPLEMGFEEPDVSLDPMEMGDIPAEDTLMAALSQGVKAAPRGQATRRSEAATTGSGYIWTRPESSR